MQLQPADIHEGIVVVNARVAPVPVEDAGVIRQQILLLRPNVRERLSPKLNPDLPVRRDCPGWQTALGDDQGRVWSKLLQPERRFPLADLDLRFGKLMPVDENVGARKSGAVGVEPIALAKVAFDFEVEVLRKLAGQIDPRPAQPETIIDRSLTKPSLESGDIAAFEVGLNESAQHQLQFQPALKDVKWRLFFFHNRLFRHTTCRRR